MKISMIVLILAVLTGCAIVPLGYYDTYTYYPSSYYRTDNNAYSYGYSTPGYSGYYVSPYPGRYGYGYYGPRYYYGERGYLYRGGYGYYR